MTQLRDKGFTRIKNLKGGILAWVERVDPSQPKYRVRSACLDEHDMKVVKELEEVKKSGFQTLKSITR